MNTSDFAARRELVSSPALEAVSRGYANAVLQALTNWTVLELPVTGISTEAKRLYGIYLRQRFPIQMKRHWQAYNAACPPAQQVNDDGQQRWCAAIAARAEAEAAARLAGYHFDEVFLDLPNQPAQHEELFRTLQRDRLLDGMISLLDGDKLRLVLQLGSAMDEIWQKL